MYGYYYFDPTYLLLVIGMVLSLLASAKVKSTFSVYSRVRSASGLTGADAARRIHLLSRELRSLKNSRRRVLHLMRL